MSKTDQFLPEESTRKDTYAYMDHLLDSLLLKLSMDHNVTHPDGKEETSVKTLG